jgi:hypothetical protein
MPERLLARMKTAGGYSPTERLLLIQGWAAVTEDGTELESGTDNFDIIGIAVGVVEGRLVQTPLLVVDGELTNLEDCRTLRWSEITSLEEVVVCCWPRHCDEEMLRERIEVLRDRARRTELERFAQSKGTTVEALADGMDLDGPLPPPELGGGQVKESAAETPRVEEEG